MDWPQALTIRSEIVDALESDKRPNLTLEQLEYYHHAMAQVRRIAMGRGHSGEGEKHFLEVLNQAIAVKRAERQADRHHSEAIALGKENQDLGQRSLDVAVSGRDWSRIAAVAGILALLVAAASLAVQIYTSRSPLSTPATPSPTSSPQMSATITPTVTPSASIAIPSPQPTAETSPTESP